MQWICFAITLFLLVSTAIAYELEVTVETATNATDYNQTETIQYKVIVKNSEGTSPDDITYALSHWVKDDQDNEIKAKQTTQKALKRSKTETFQWTPDYGGSFFICAEISGVTNETILENNQYCIPVVVTGSSVEEEVPMEETNKESEQKPPTNEQTTITINK